MAIGGYLYGKLCEKAFQPDDRAPPTVRINDGEDYVPMKKWKNSLIQLLNIEGTGSVLEEEYVFPKFDGLPENAPMGKLKKRRSLVPGPGTSFWLWKSCFPRQRSLRIPDPQKGFGEIRL